MSVRVWCGFSRRTRRSAPYWGWPAGFPTGRPRRRSGWPSTWPPRRPTRGPCSRVRTPSSIWPGPSSPRTIRRGPGGPTCWAASGSSRRRPRPGCRRWYTRRRSARTHRVPRTTPWTSRGRRTAGPTPRTAARRPTWNARWTPSTVPTPGCGWCGCGPPSCSSGSRRASSAGSSGAASCRGRWPDPSCCRSCRTFRDCGYRPCTRTTRRRRIGSRWSPTCAARSTSRPSPRSTRACWARCSVPARSASRARRPAPRSPPPGGCTCCPLRRISSTRFSGCR